MTSLPVMLPVVEAMPAIFTQSQSGTGPGAILNEDFTLNTAANPARPGSMIFVFGTGAGETNPSSSEGLITPADLRWLRLPYAVTISGAQADVQFAGAAPMQTPGLFQMNVRVPMDATGPVAPIVVSVGRFASAAPDRELVTVFVQR